MTHHTRARTHTHACTHKNTALPQQRDRQRVSRDAHHHRKYGANARAHPAGSDNGGDNGDPI